MGKRDFVFRWQSTLTANAKPTILYVSIERIPVSESLPLIDQSSSPCGWMVVRYGGLDSSCHEYIYTFLVITNHQSLYYAQGGWPKNIGHFQIIRKNGNSKNRAPRVVWTTDKSLNDRQSPRGLGTWLGRVTATWNWSIDRSNFCTSMKHTERTSKQCPDNNFIVPYRTLTAPIYPPIWLSKFQAVVVLSTEHYWVLPNTGKVAISAKYCFPIWNAFK